MIEQPYQFIAGDSPLLISMPHVGTRLTPVVEAGLVDAARPTPDTDWHLPILYHFAQAMGASMLIARYNRYVIDLNRPEDNQPLYPGATTGLFPDTFFDGSPLFSDGKAPSEADHQTCIEQIWRPYHQKIQQELARIKARYGYALLFDAHSIRSVIPYLFDGRLPDLNLGTFNGASCAPALEQQVTDICAGSDYSWVLNGRFTGGYITRQYGQPEQGVHAVQLEMAQEIYMEEQLPFRYDEVKAAKLIPVLQQLIGAIQAFKPV